MGEPSDVRSNHSLNEFKKIERKYQVSKDSTDAALAHGLNRFLDFLLDLRHALLDADVAPVGAIPLHLVDVLEAQR